MWLTNLTLVLEDRIVPHAALRMEDGVIAELGAAGQLQPQRNGHAPVDCNGSLLIPGLIDMHGDMIEREVEPRPGARLPFAMAIHELDRRLSSNGVTTAYPAVSFSEISIRTSALRKEKAALELVEAIDALRPQLLVDTRIHARFEVTNPNAPPLLEQLIRAGRVHLISLNDHTPGQGQYRDIEGYIEQMKKWAAVSEEYQGAGLRERIVQAQARPIAWDVIEKLCKLARTHNIPIASHDDDTREKVNWMRTLGAGMSEFPVTVEAARAARDAGMSIVMGAPNAFRGMSNTGNLSARDALAAGLLDLLAADYHPGCLLQAAFALARADLATLPAAIALVTVNVARALGLERVGALRQGWRADLALVEAGNWPRVRATWRAGRRIYSDGTV